MSKDFQHNIRDLYRSKGKKLADDKEQSKLASQEKLAQSASDLSTQTSISPLLQDKLLKLHITISSVPEQPVLQSFSYKNHKSEVQMLLLTFGINFQRVHGSAIPSLQFFYDQFLITHPEITQFLFKDCEKAIETLHEHGLLYQLSPVILFEPLETSNDINKLFALLQPNDHALRISSIQKFLPGWSQEKIQRIITILVDNSLAILDNDMLWFPQLE